ncbi:recombination mediator RecR [Acidocella aromatica]|uniref:Recombination protein RecR n=1 Tax=Acidocella aromatica TaxID=1303579 RepID=A0A840VKB4_9PROT|nr:recombination mediator RecR [Acidocella aromatica]MBB5372031.1 recombination protein RecR [Acidocella aromatica]
MGGPELENLIAQFARLPGLGPRSARRIVLKLLTERDTRLLPLADALRQASAAVRSCSICGNLDTQDPCTICADHSRENRICVVEGVADLWALERAHVYRGGYHVLGGTLSAIAGRGPEDLAIAPLLARVEREHPEEIILALPATVDGAATAHVLTDRLKPFSLPVSRLAQGVPMGGTLEVLDEGTLATALRARSPA